jgi:hypothetical protein
LDGIPAARPVQEEKDRFPFPGMARIQPPDALDRRFEMFAIGGEFLLVGIGKIRQQCEQQMGVLFAK